MKFVSMSPVCKRVHAIHYGQLPRALAFSAKATGSIRLFRSCLGATIRSCGSVHHFHVSEY